MIFGKPAHGGGEKREGTMLEFKNVTGTGKKFRLEQISFAAREGYLTGIAGKNGAGKTTLFHYMMDEKIPYEGEILFRGKNIKEDHAAFRAMLGYVSDERRFFENYTGKRNAELLSVFYPDWDMDLFLETLGEMGVSREKNLMHLSRGEYLKFQMAFAMGHDAKLFLLDEVTGGMDPVFRRDFYKLLHGLIAKEDITILMTTHIEEEIELHMDYLGIMENGRMTSFGEVGESNGTDERI